MQNLRASSVSISSVKTSGTPQLNGAYALKINLYFVQLERADICLVYRNGNVAFFSIVIENQRLDFSSATG